MTHKSILPSLVALLLVLGSRLPAFAQGTAFTYQGFLTTSNGVMGNGTYDFRFALFDAASGGMQLGGLLTNSATDVRLGLFNVSLDFGYQYPGDPRWLEVAVRPAGSGAFATLAPRQLLGSVPYAVQAASAQVAATAASVPATSIQGTLPVELMPPTVVTNGPGGLVNLTGAFAGNGAGLTNLNAATLGGVAGGNFWQLGGNTVSGGQFLGSTNSQAVEIKVNGVRAMRYEPAANTPNVVGGYGGNVASNGVYAATIGGGGAAGFENRIGGNYGTVAGGYGNTASGNTATVGGGFNNTARAFFTTVGGGANNAATASSATVAGGGDNAASGSSATVGGGSGNTASANSATVAGGLNNIASGVQSTVGGGNNNAASTNTATVAGGVNNSASGISATVGGGNGNFAVGDCATVAGGSNNFAGGAYSFAGGQRAKALHAGSFVWADTQNADFATRTADQFLIRAQGGVGINKTNPVFLLDVAGAIGATAFNNTSDQAAKENFATVSAQEMLAKVVGLPITQWNFKGENTRHVGPMAQDFYAAFNIGPDDKHIATVDADGVALAAIQGLNQKLERQNAELRRELAEIKRLLQKR